MLSILNLVLASPIVVQEIHEARRNEMVVAEDVIAMPNKWRELEVASDRSASPSPRRPRSPPDPMATPQHMSPDSPDSSYSLFYGLPVSSQESAYPHRSSPGLSETSSVHLPASLHEPASPHRSSTGSSETPPPWWKQWLGSETPSPHLPASSDEPAPHTSGSWSSETPAYPPALLHESTSPHRSSTGSSETPPPWWKQWLGSETPSPHLPASSDEPAPHTSGSWSSETPPYSPAPLHESASLHPSGSGSSEIPQYPSASGGSLSSHYFSASHDLTSDGSPPSHSSTPAETPQDSADSELFNEKMMKKLKIVGVLAIVGATVASIVAPQMKHHKHSDRDFQDSRHRRFNKDSTATLASSHKKLVSHSCYSDHRLLLQILGELMAQ
ncbi:hypothetical protein BGY98DRAFT_1096440 [Russula aff. rugulosa BPL654]|nr:hypothetical protein BGY98DRAFT_1096440 [Russula aff. rugulosa BPL654]